MLKHTQHNNHTNINTYNNIINTTHQQCIQQYGFVCNPDKPTWQNIHTVISNTPTTIYFTQIKNNTFHNLCTLKQPPKGLGRTLGLGLKFCIQEPLPTKEPDYDRFCSDVRKRFMFAGQDSPKMESCPKNLIIKSEWIPYEQSDELESKLNNFIKKTKNTT